MPPKTDSERLQERAQALRKELGLHGVLLIGFEHQSGEDGTANWALDCEPEKTEPIIAAVPSVLSQVLQSIGRTIDQLVARARAN